MRWPVVRPRPARSTASISPPWAGSPAPRSGGRKSSPGGAGEPRRGGHQTDGGLRRAPPALPVQRHIFEAGAVVDAVDHGHQPLDLWLPAIGRVWIEEDRPRVVRDQDLLDVPYQMLALLDVGLGRLLVHQPVHRLVAIPGVIALRAADIVL